MGSSVGRRKKPCKPIIIFRTDKREPKTHFVPVDVTTHNWRFQKSSLWLVFLEIIVFCDKKKCGFRVNERPNRREISAFSLHVNGLQCENGINVYDDVKTSENTVTGQYIVILMCCF